MTQTFVSALLRMRTVQAACFFTPSEWRGCCSRYVVVEGGGGGAGAAVGAPGVAGAAGAEGTVPVPLFTLMSPFTVEIFSSCCPPLTSPVTRRLPGWEGVFS